jgi:hypothetical protein
MNISNLLILLTLTTVSSCALMDRRDFSDQMNYRFDEPMFRPNQDFMVMAGDTGRDYDSYEDIMSRTPANEKVGGDYRYEKSLQRELSYLERKMDDSEYFEYTRFKNRLGSTSEKIYFLRLSPSEQNEYLRLRKIEARSQQISQNYENRRNVASSNSYSPYSQGRRSPSAFETIKKDITLGMSKDDAVRSWGMPERRDIDGDPMLQNERWAYRRNGITKYIYFEGGKVEGWSEQ